MRELFLDSEEIEFVLDSIDREMGLIDTVTRLSKKPETLKEFSDKVCMLNDLRCKLID